MKRDIKVKLKATIFLKLIIYLIVILIFSTILILFGNKILTSSFNISVSGLIIVILWILLETNFIPEFIIFIITKKYERSHLINNKYFKLFFKPKK